MVPYPKGKGFMALPLGTPTRPVVGASLCFTPLASDEQGHLSPFTGRASPLRSRAACGGNCRLVPQRIAVFPVSRRQYCKEVLWQSEIRRILRISDSFWLEKTTSSVVPKSFSYAQSRRSGKPPSDEGGGKNL